MIRKLMFFTILTATLFLGVASSSSKVNALCDCDINPECSPVCPNKPPPCGGLFQPPCLQEKGK